MAFFRVVQGAEGVPAGEDQPDGVQVPDESLVRGKGQGHFFFSGKLQEGALPDTRAGAFLRRGRAAGDGPGGRGRL